MVSQFVSPDRVALLGELGYPFPEGTHAVGRLDKDSEGLLLLTTDKTVTRRLFSVEKPHRRTYLVMVRNHMDDGAFEHLRDGINIRIKNGVDYLAKPVSVTRVNEVSTLYPWATDSREAYAHTWLLITLVEGKFRQVRKMTLALGHRCLRLIRLSIEDLTIDGMAPGTVKEIDGATFFTLARLSD